MSKRRAGTRQVGTFTHQILGQQLPAGNEEVYPTESNLVFPDGQLGVMGKDARMRETRLILSGRVDLRSRPITPMRYP